MILETICYLFDDKLAALGVPTTDVEANVAIDVRTIECIREVMNEEKTDVDPNICIIYMRDVSVLIKTPYKEVLRLKKESIK